MTNHCVKLALFLQVEQEIIEKHIAEHKWFRQIADHNQGVADFIENYGWLMREMYCTHICPARSECALAQAAAPAAPAAPAPAAQAS